MGMPRLIAMVAFALVLAACSGDGADGTTTTTTSGDAAPTTTTAPSTTTTEPGVTTTTAAPETTTTTEPPPPLQGLDWQPVVAVGGFITGIEPIDDDMLLSTKDGVIRRVVDGEARTEADLSGLVRNSGEQGLLDIALHPDGGRLFVHYTARNGDTVLGELPYPIEGARPTTLYQTDQPAGNHNGGSVEFGPDGMLYLALGDGGGGGDQFGNGQRPDTPLAAIHRFDVSTEGVAVAPPDNPFPDGEVPTLWAYGLRNPWRIAFDDGRLIVADVGQNAWEEVTVVDASEPGPNFGWPILEGRHCYLEPGCDTTGLLLAQLEVAHGDGGTCSITGGEVYRGTAIPELSGHYVFTDFCGGYLRSFPTGDGVPGPVEEATQWDVPRLEGPAVIAAGPDGEFLAGGSNGRLLRLVPLR